jgi:uncharacterized OB-fold protein
VSHFPLPELDPDTEPFWTGGSSGRLRITRCAACGLWLHPPQPVCRRCLSTDVAPDDASGFGTVFTFTVNHQPWIPGVAVPYTLAIVELDEQAGLRLTTRLVGIEPGAVRIGLRVQVTFEQADDVWLPLFTPVPEP